MPDPAPTDIELWLVDDRDVSDPGLLEQYLALLSPMETGRHQRFVFPHDRHQFLVARALVRTVLGQYLEQDPASLVFSQTAHGKPCLAHESPLQFNLTHTRGMIVLAVTTGAPLGVDVEYVNRVADVAKLTERYFSPAEASALYELPVELWNERFFDLWTLKEAYVKGCGTGLHTPLRYFSFGFTDSAISIAFSGPLEDDPRAWQFWQMSIDDRFRLALAINDTPDTAYRITARKGLPLASFQELTLPVLRQSITGSSPGSERR